MKQFKNDGNELTTAKKMENLFKWSQELSTKAFSKNQKRMIHDVMTLGQSLYRKQSRGKVVPKAKEFKSRTIEIIYNLAEDRMEFVCPDASFSLKTEHFPVVRFEPKKIDTQIERVFLLRINLETLTQRMSDEEINEIFINKEFTQKRPYEERRILAFKNKAGFEKFLGLIVDKIKRSFKTTYLSFMKNNYSENLPLYFSETQLEKFENLFLERDSAVSYYFSNSLNDREGIVFVSSKLLYQFIEEHSVLLKSLEDFVNHYVYDSMSVYSKNYDNQKDTVPIKAIKQYMVNQLFSTLGPTPGLEELKRILEPHFDNLSDENITGIRNSLISVFNSVVYLSKIDKSFSCVQFKEFFDFFNEKIKLLESFGNKRSSLLNEIDIDAFIDNNTLQPYTVGLSTISFWQNRLARLLNKGYNVKFSLFSTNDHTFREGFNNLLTLKNTMRNEEKENSTGTVTLYKDELSVILGLKHLWLEKESEIKDALDYIEKFAILE